jgi:3-oxo-5alpha-steroid 4-dehydrogenase
MTQTYSPSKSVALADVAQWHIESDVIVIGFGAAGGCAAIEAA